MESTDGRDFRIVRISHEHTPAVAGLHRAALPNGFLSTLGDGFLGALYLAIDRAPDSVVWVAASPGGEVLGFVSGTLSTGRCYRSIMFSPAMFRLVGHLVPSLANVGTLKRTWETAIYPLRRSRQEEPGPSGSGAELLSIAVGGKARGLGIGRSLVERLESTFLEHGLQGPYNVVTDAEDERSNAFYLGVGFRFVESFRHHGHPMCRYAKNIAAVGTA